MDKCKKSVFCVLFFVFFFLGTICGVMLFSFQGKRENSAWLRTYCQAILGSGEGAGFWSLFAAMRPVVLAWLGSFLRHGDRLVLLLTALRGCLMTYCAAACYACSLPADDLALRGVLILPLFYLVCRYSYRCCRERQSER